MIKPLHDNVLIEPVVEETVTKKGIIISTNNEENQNTTKGKVIAIGDGHLYKSDKTFTFGITIGSIVYFKEYSGTSVVLNNKTYKMLSYEDIVGIEE